MAKDSSASVREQAPHLIHIPYGDEPTRTGTVLSALTRRAQAVLNDRSIDPQSRVMIRYALETRDPWLAELVRRADAGESFVETVDFSQEPQTRNDDDFDVEKIEALAEMICRDGDEPDTKSAALLVLMAALEGSAHPKALANTVKHLAFNHCAERNLCGMVDAEIRVLDAELFAGKAFGV
jgi:hypothetical protein